ncbi:hypothetical protein LC040_13645 [Bacillus tianshenii]|nr:hypothetical protein LC040_13645 [Bacillus tianshenii]
MSGGIGPSIVAVVLSIFLFIPGAVNDSIQPLSSTVATAESASYSELEEEDIARATQSFIDTLVQNSDENYRVTRYDNKEELLDAFDSIAVEKAVKPYVDYYFQEKNGDLYIKPTELPPWFKPNQSYEIDQIDNTHAKVQQSNETSLYGNYTITIDFLYKNEQWVIQDVHYQ